MILHLILGSLLWAQTPSAEHFQKFCDQIPAEVPSENLSPNRGARNLRAIGDVITGVPKQMRDAIRRQKTYEEFKLEAQAKGESIQDSFHQQSYIHLARLRCAESLTEGGPGNISTEAHSAMTKEQDSRRVNDVEPLRYPGDSGTTGSGTTD